MRGDNSWLRQPLAKHLARRPRVGRESTVRSSTSLCHLHRPHEGLDRLLQCTDDTRTSQCPLRTRLDSGLRHLDRRIDIRRWDTSRYHTAMEHRRRIKGNGKERKSVCIAASADAPSTYDGLALR